MATNDDLRSAMVKHAIYIQRYSGGVVKRVNALLKSADSDLVAQLLTLEDKIFTSPLTLQRIDTLLGSVRLLNQEVYSKVYSLLTTEAANLTAHESQYQVNQLETAFDNRIDLIVPPPQTLLAAALAQPFQGRLLRDWVDGLSDATTQRLGDAMRIGVVEGEGIDQIVRRVKGTRALGYKDGILEISRRSAEALTRTSVNHVVNHARQQTFDANSGVIQGIQWVSTLDARTSSICQARDGKVFPLNSGPRPPAHINCRSSTSPVLKSWAAMGLNMPELPASTRASMNGQVAEIETYQTWLSKQGAAFQDEVLGPTKGKLFRNGELPLDRFVDRVGNELTIDELRVKEPVAFKLAGIN